MQAAIEQRSRNSCSGLNIAGSDRSAVWEPLQRSKYCRQRSNSGLGTAAAIEQRSGNRCSGLNIAGSDRTAVWEPLQRSKYCRQRSNSGLGTAAAVEILQAAIEQRSRNSCSGLNLAGSDRTAVSEQLQRSKSCRQRSNSGLGTAAAV